MPIPLTKKQSEILAFIKAYQEKNAGISPSLDEMCKAFPDENGKPKSLSTMWEHIAALEFKGWLKRYPKFPRGIELL